MPLAKCSNYAMLLCSRFNPTMLSNLPIIPLNIQANTGNTILHSHDIVTTILVAKIYTHTVSHAIDRKFSNTSCPDRLTRQFTLLNSTRSTC